MRISDWSSDVCSSDLNTFRTCTAAHAWNRFLAKHTVDDPLDRGQLPAAVIWMIRPLPRPEGAHSKDYTRLQMSKIKIQANIVGWGHTAFGKLSGDTIESLIASAAKHDRKSTRLNSSHQCAARMPSYA